MAFILVGVIDVKTMAAIILGLVILLAANAVKESIARAISGEPKAAEADAAANAIEELEETAKLFLILRGSKIRLLTDEQVAALNPA